MTELAKSASLVVRLTALAALCLAIDGVFGEERLHASPPVPASSGAGAQQLQREVGAAFKQLEKAIRDGNGALYLSLLDRKTIASMSNEMKEQYQKRSHAQPWVRMEPAAIAVSNDQAFVLGSYEDPPNQRRLTYRIWYVREDGAWKIAEQTLSDAPLYRPAVYAFFPPAGGAFTLARSPWQKIPYAALNSKYFKEDEQPWKLQATRDEAFLYVRFAAKIPLPAPGSAVPERDAKLAKTGVPSGPPVMVIAITTSNDKHTLVITHFRFQVGANIGTHATFDRSGKATSNRYFLAYSLAVTNDAGEQIFESTPDAHNPLIAVHDRFVDMKFPLKSLGLDEMSKPDIEVKEFNSLPKILPYKVGQFSP